jgi:DNA-binding PadR family transcriptional regulator
MAEPQLTPFEHILIGLVCLSPASGYDLKRKFAATPIGVYQPSSGSLYPALRRLEAKGLVKALDGTGESARHRRVYEPTAAGRAVHATWLRTPVDVSTVARDLGLHLMRFVMMEHASSREEVLSFLGALKDALAAFTAGMQRYAAASAPTGDRHPGLALDHGLEVYRASLRWTRRTIAALADLPVPREIRSHICRWSPILPACRFRRTRRSPMSRRWRPAGRATRHGA